MNYVVLAWCLLANSVTMAQMDSVLRPEDVASIRKQGKATKPRLLEPDFAQENHPVTKAVGDDNPSTFRGLQSIVGVTYTMDYIARFQSLIGVRCNDDGNKPLIDLYCIGDINVKNTSHSSITCSDPPNPIPGWNVQRCFSNCATREACEAVYLNEGSDMGVPYASITFTCSGPTFRDSDAAMTIGSESESNCVSSTEIASGDGRLFHMGQLGFECGTGSARTPNFLEDFAVECSLGNFNGIFNDAYTCYDGRNCGETDACSEEIDDVIINVDIDRVPDECVVVSDGSSVPDVTTLIDDRDPGTYSARFQSNWQLDLGITCDLNDAANPLIFISCENGFISDPTPDLASIDCNIITSSTMSCQDTVGTTFKDSYSGVQFTCTAEDEMPMARVDLPSMTVSCTSTQARTNTNRLQMAVQCVDPNDGSLFFFFDDYFFECENNDAIDFEIQSLTCLNSVEHTGGTASSSTIPNTAIFTDHRYANAEFDSCHTFVPKQTAAPMSPPTDSPTDSPSASPTRSPSREPTSAPIATPATSLPLQSFGISATMVLPGMSEQMTSATRSLWATYTEDHIRSSLDGTLSDVQVSIDGISQTLSSPGSGRLRFLQASELEVDFFLNVDYRSSIQSNDQVKLVGQAFATADDRKDYVDGLQQQSIQFIGVDRIDVLVDGTSITTAPMPLGESSAPTPSPTLEGTPTSRSTPVSDDGGGSSTGLIIGIVAGVALLGGLMLGYMCYLKGKLDKRNEDNASTSKPTNSVSVPGSVPGPMPTNSVSGQHSGGHSVSGTSHSQSTPIPAIPTAMAVASPIDFQPSIYQPPPVRSQPMDLPSNMDYKDQGRDFESIMNIAAVVEPSPAPVPNPPTRTLSGDDVYDC